VSKLFLFLTLAGLSACAGTNQAAQVSVLGSQRIDSRARVVFVRVVNTSRSEMRLEQLHYSFESAGQAIEKDSLSLSRDVSPGAAVMVEVPLPPLASIGASLTLSGVLFARLESMEQTFPVQGEVIAETMPR
jgi:hypothetical protein